MLALQDVRTWGDALERFGLPIVVLIVFGIAFYKLFWPLILKYHDSLEEQIREARAARKDDTEKFLKALEGRDEVNKEQTKAIEALTRQIDDLRNEDLRGK